MSRRRTRPDFFTLAVILAAVALSPGACRSADRLLEAPTRRAASHSAKPSETVEGRVVKITDGDTIHVVAGGTRYKVRLIGVDTPESTREKEPYGKAASRYTAAQLGGRRVWLETDAELYDRYGRLLAYVWLDQPDSRSDDEVRSKMFNARLVEEGYAQMYTFPPNVRYADVFLGLQRSARAKGAGLWAVSGAADPLSGKRSEALP